MRAVVLLAPELATLPVAGRALADHWVFVAGLAGLAVSVQPPDASSTEATALVIDGRFAALSPDSMRSLADRTTPGALLAASGRPVAARLDGAGPPRLAERLASTWEVAGVLPADEADALPEAASGVERAVRQRWLDHLARAGARFVDPARTIVDTTVQVSPTATVWPDTVLRGATRVGPGAEIQPGAFLEDTEIDEGALVRPYTVASGARIGPGATVGPFAHLRAGAVLEAETKVGNFVEVKQATLRRGAKASHLTYLGDAEIGPDANVGAGTITCNYDGFGKYRTTIGAGAFVGSNSSLVAPVTIGRGAIVGAGSVVTRDVPDEALYVERAVPKLFEGHAPRLRERNRLRAQKRPDPE